MNVRQSESGIALVTAILVVAIAAIASAAILASANIAIRRTANLQDSELAWWYASGVEAFVASVLERDLEDNKTDSFVDPWSKAADYLPVDEGFVRGQVYDLQGRFNLNNLGAGSVNDAAYQQQVAIFVRLLAQAGVESEQQAQAIAAGVRDWIDADSEPTGFDGAEDTEYLGIVPAYRSANRPISSTSELLAVRGMTREVFTNLRDWVAALPLSGTPINVNTAPEPVLRALAREPGAALATFVQERVERPAENVSELYNERAVFGADDAAQNLMSVASRFFMLRAEIYIGSGRVALYSFYFRPSTGSAPVVYGRSTDIE